MGSSCYAVLPHTPAQHSTAQTTDAHRLHTQAQMGSACYAAWLTRHHTKALARLASQLPSLCWHRLPSLSFSLSLQVHSIYTAHHHVTAAEQRPDLYQLLKLQKKSADPTKPSVHQWLRSGPDCFVGVQESQVRNGGAEQGSDVHQLLQLYKEEREQLSKDVLYYKQSCKDLKRRLKTEVLLGVCVLGIRISSSSVLESSCSSMLEILSMHSSCKATAAKLFSGPALLCANAGGW